MKRSGTEEKSPGGIVLPDTAKKKPKRGTVVNIGNGKLLKNGQRLPLQVKKGQEVVFSSAYMDDLVITTAALGDDAGLLGALALVEQKEM